MYTNLRLFLFFTVFGGWACLTPDHRPSFDDISTDLPSDDFPRDDTFTDVPMTDTFTDVPMTDTFTDIPTTDTMTDQPPNPGGITLDTPVNSATSFLLSRRVLHDVLIPASTPEIVGGVRLDPREEALVSFSAGTALLTRELLDEVESHHDQEAFFLAALTGGLLEQVDDALDVSVIELKVPLELLIAGESWFVDAAQFKAESANSFRVETRLRGPREESVQLAVRKGRVLGADYQLTDGAYDPTTWKIAARGDVTAQGILLTSVQSQRTGPGTVVHQKYSFESGARPTATQFAGKISTGASLKVGDVLNLVQPISDCERACGVVDGLQCSAGATAFEDCLRRCDGWAASQRACVLNAWTCDELDACGVSPR